MNKGTCVFAQAYIWVVSGITCIIPKIHSSYIGEKRLIKYSRQSTNAILTQMSVLFVWNDWHDFRIWIPKVRIKIESILFGFHLILFSFFIYFFTYYIFIFIPKWSQNKTKYIRDFLMTFTCFERKFGKNNKN